MNPQGHSKTGWILAGFLVVTVVVAGWISDVTSSPAASGSAGSATAIAVGPATAEATSTPTSGSSFAPPSWAAALGPDAIVYPPQSAVPGHDNPSDAAAFFAEVKAKNLVGTCFVHGPEDAE